MKVQKILLLKYRLFFVILIQHFMVVNLYKTHNFLPKSDSISIIFFSFHKLAINKLYVPATGEYAALNKR